MADDSAAVSPSPSTNTLAAQPMDTKPSESVVVEQPDDTIPIEPVIVEPRMATQSVEPAVVGEHMEKPPNERAVESPVKIDVQQVKSCQPQPGKTLDLHYPPATCKPAGTPSAKSPFMASRLTVAKTYNEMMPPALALEVARAKQEQALALEMLAEKLPPPRVPVKAEGPMGYPIFPKPKAGNAPTTAKSYPPWRTAQQPCQNSCTLTNGLPLTSFEPQVSSECSLTES